MEVRQIADVFFSLAKWLPHSSHESSDPHYPQMKNNRTGSGNNKAGLFAVAITTFQKKKKILPLQNQSDNVGWPSLTFSILTKTLNSDDYLRHKSGSFAFPPCFKLSEFLFELMVCCESLHQVTSRWFSGGDNRVRTRIIIWAGGGGRGPAW